MSDGVSDGWQPVKLVPTTIVPNRELEALRKVAEAAKQLMALSIVLDAHPWLPWPALRAALAALEKVRDEA